MRIAQIAPLMESVPPKRYGGTERIVSYLTEELVRAGHEVTLFASAISRTGAELRRCATSACASRRRPRTRSPITSRCWRRSPRAHEFDIVHVHVDLLHLCLLRDQARAA